MNETAELRPDAPALWPADYIRPGLPPEHCADVLAGSYDVPFTPSTPPVILDIGANVGAFARWASTRWPGCTIHCYEPAPENFALLKRTIKDLVPADVRVHAHERGVFNCSGKMCLYEGPYNCGEYSLFGDKNSGRPVFSINVVDASTLPRANILKLDAEGAELAILRRFEELGRLADFAAIMYEFHADVIQERCEKMLLAAGFVEVGRNVISQHRGEMKYMRPLP